MILCLQGSAADAADVDANDGLYEGVASGDDPLVTGDLKARATGIVRDVLDTVDGVSAEPVPMLEVVVETTPSLIHYQSGDDGTSVVVVPNREGSDEEGEDPEVYGWFQFGFVLDAYAHVAELDLATIARDDLGL